MKHKHVGFTLLELLLVISLMTAIGIMGIAMYRQRAIVTKAEKTSLQIQQWLQAGLAYYAHNQHWPPAEGADFNDFHDHYLPLPERTSNNPWGKPYRIATAEENDNPNIFQIRTEVVPYINYYGEPKRDAIARRIAAHLPAADVIADTTVVKSEVGLPGQIVENNNGISIIAIHRIELPVDANYQIEKPDERVCPPASKHARVYYSIEGFSFIEDHARQTYQLNSARVNPDMDPLADAYWKPGIVIKATIQRGDHSPYVNQRGVVIAIVTCEPGPKMEVLKAAQANAQRKFIF